MSYDKSEVDALVASLNSRIDTSNVTLSTVNSAVTAHNISPDAHNTIFATKALKTTVSELSGTVDDLVLRIQDLENFNILKGTLSYSLVGTAGETNVSIAFDIQPIDESHPVTYEVYGDGTLIEGLTFNAAAGTITGTPTYGGTATYIILAKSGNYGAFITVNQNFEGDKQPVIAVTPMSPVTAAVGTAISDIRIQYLITKPEDGVEATLTASGLPDGLTMSSSGVISGTPTTTGTFSSIITIEYPGADIITTTVEFTIVTEDEYSFNTIKQLLTIGDIDTLNTYLGVPISIPLNDHDGVTRNYRVMMTSVDTDDTPGYEHNARFEFLDVVDESIYDGSNRPNYQVSNIRYYLTVGGPDGFMSRLPAWLRKMIVPTNIECAIFDGDVGSRPPNATETLSDKVFLPSVWELCGTLPSSYMVTEGTKSTYYPTSIIRHDTRRRYDRDGEMVRWWTRTTASGGGSSIASVYEMDPFDNGGFNTNPMSNDVHDDSYLAPAFVIAV